MAKMDFEEYATEFGWQYFQARLASQKNPTGTKFSAPRIMSGINFNYHRVQSYQLVPLPFVMTNQ